ncbi:MAG: hypothetical protein A3F68_07785 [Acidobacteria bacterium RIFCSPLOWO2_12_FULL_54_10]|nr:MAG: hypothetical protein A3F68_07785 [Acidobacteria bacterium RIFCSPLOWO2_12_FULL_54_10]
MLLSAVVELVRASKIYQANGNQVFALRDASLALEPSSFTAVVGRSGCGKSTLLNLAGAVDLPSSGEVFIDQQLTRGLNDADLSRLRRTKIGFVFQFFNLLPTLTVAENVELPLLLGGQKDSRQQESRILELLEMVGLEKKAQSYPHQLSGGEMQRASIARALVHHPVLVLADEPTGNLDDSNAQTVIGLLLRISQSGCAVLLATHSKQAASVASRILFMRDGMLIDTENLS